MNRDRALIGVSAILLGAFAYDGVIRPLAAPAVALPPVFEGVRNLTIPLVLFSVVHAWAMLGARRAAVFFVASAVISWAFEQAGVATGAVYGRYHYTDVLGPKLGHVPVLIPLAWFMMIYPSWVIAGLLTRHDASPGRPRRGILPIALAAAVVMTAWDLVVDPILSGPAVRAWIWEDGGAYFGVPWHNYAGWLATTFTVYLTYAAIDRRMEPAAVADYPRRWVALPLAAYGIMMVANLAAVGRPRELLIIAPVVMGVPLVLAAWRLSRIVELPEGQNP